MIHVIQRVAWHQSVRHPESSQGCHIRCCRCKVAASAITRDQDPLNLHAELLLCLSNDPHVRLVTVVDGSWVGLVRCQPIVNTENGHTELVSQVSCDILMRSASHRNKATAMDVNHDISGRRFVDSDLTLELVVAGRPQDTHHNLFVWLEGLLIHVVVEVGSSAFLGLYHLAQILRLGQNVLE